MVANNGQNRPEYLIEKYGRKNLKSLNFLKLEREPIYLSLKKIIYAGRHALTD